MLLFVSAALTVAVFRAYPQQRPAIMDEVLTTVIANLAVVGSRGPVRLFETTDAAVRPLPMMMATALVMQLVEVGPELLACSQTVRDLSSTAVDLCVPLGCCLRLIIKGVRGIAHLMALIDRANVLLSSCRHPYSYLRWMLILTASRLPSRAPMAALMCSGRACLHACLQPRQPRVMGRQTSSWLSRHC